VGARGRIAVWAFPHTFNKYELHNKYIEIIARRMSVMREPLLNKNRVVLKEEVYIGILFSLSYNFKGNIKAKN
jgi:hypothetical protein